MYATDGSVLSCRGGAPLCGRAMLVSCTGRPTHERQPIASHGPAAGRPAGLTAAVGWWGARTDQGRSVPAPSGGTESSCCMHGNWERVNVYTLGTHAASPRT